MAVARERIGDMLVAAGLITTGQLEEALAAQAQSRLRVGKQLVRLGYVGEMQLTQILSNQLSVPWVSLERIEFSSALLSRVPGEVADAHAAIPIYVRSVRPHGDTLYVAMDDPTDEEAIRRIATIAGLPVRPMIAAPSDIRRAIEARYFGGEDGALASGEPGVTSSPLAVGAAVTPMAQTTMSPATRRDWPSVAPPEVEARKSTKVRPPPPPPARPSRPEGVVAVESYDVPSDPPPAPSRMLTLLDGTRIALPASSKLAVGSEATEVRHVVKAVRQAALELGLEDAPRWHDVVQALLDALANRGLRVTRKEIQQAWSKRLSESRRPDKG